MAGLVAGHFLRKERYEETRKHNPVDGKINTSDLLYTMELDFKENLSKSFGTVKIKNGKNIVTSEDGGG